MKDTHRITICWDDLTSLDYDEVKEDITLDFEDLIEVFELNKEVDSVMVKRDNDNFIEYISIWSTLTQEEVDQIMVDTLSNQE